jgi:hypothetical protein
MLPVDPTSPRPPFAGCRWLRYDAPVSDAETPLAAVALAMLRGEIGARG